VHESAWEKTAAWTTVEQPTYSISYSNLKASISAEDAEQGLIRVFKADDAAKASVSHSLPYEDKINGKQVYWYYQVTEGNLMLSVDAYGAKASAVDKSLFKYVVIGKDVIASLEDKGISKASLMDMSYEDLVKITK
jgi:hypothetical protein